MSETNGNEPEWLERLERVEASHVKLMTDHEVFVKEQERDWRQQRKRWRKAEQRAAELAARGGIDFQKRSAEIEAKVGVIERRYVFPQRYCLSD